MSDISDFLFHYRDDANCKSDRTLTALEFAFEKSELEFPRTRITEGTLPFAEFANWLARKLGKSQKGIYGGWPRYDGSCWGLIREFVPNEEEQFNAFFEWYEEFRLISVRCCLTANVPFKNKRQDHAGVAMIEVWECLPNSGFLTYLVFADGHARPDRFYARLDEALESAKQRFGIVSNNWRRY